MRRLYWGSGLVLFGMLLLCGRASGQSNVIAQYTVNVGAQAPAARVIRVPNMEMVGGKQIMKLGRDENGQTVGLAVGNFIILRFPEVSGAMRYTIDPPHGVLESPPGIYHMPNGAIGIVQAMNAGTATITVQSVTSSKVSGAGNASGRTSPNWSGYVLDGGPFTGIEGEWTVPTVQNDGGNVSCTWIGIDGDGNTSLIQVGTEQDYYGGFLGIGAGPQYYAWWEILPASQTSIPGQVSPGDQMLAIINPVVSGTAKPNTTTSWAITLMDKTKGWTFTTTQSYAGPLSSAEWIQEATTECGLFGCSINAIADYGSVSFDVFDAIDSGTAPGLTPAAAMNLVQGGATVSTPSNPDGDADGFTVAFGSNVPAPPGPFVITTGLPNAVLNQSYQAFLIASGPSVNNWAWSGTTPPGLNLNSASGLISGSPTASGVFSFSVSAEQSNVVGISTQTQPLTLTVLASAPVQTPDFSLSASPKVVTQAPTGQACSAATTVSIHPVGGFSQSVALSASNLPVGATASFSQNPSAHASLLTVSSNPCAFDIGLNDITIVGKSSGLTRTTTMGVRVTQPVQHCGKAGICNGP
jgi:Putative Ig domain